MKSSHTPKADSMVGKGTTIRTNFNFAETCVGKSINWNDNEEEKDLGMALGAEGNIIAEIEPSPVDAKGMVKYSNVEVQGGLHPLHVDVGGACNQTKRKKSSKSGGIANGRGQRTGA